MPEAEFDRFASSYRAQHAASIRLSGESPEYFAKYKIDDVAAAMALVAARPTRILDFGGGIGNSVPYMRAAFADAELVVLDPSSESLDMARQRFPGSAVFREFDGETIPYDDNHFDLIFTACVFHHIDAAMHDALLKEIFRVLRPNGSFFVFEHNPRNPLTRRAVRSCPFDKNAVLIEAGTMCGRVVGAGFPRPEIVYRIFFPRFLCRLRLFERFLSNVPLGGQYYVHAVKYS